MRNSGTFTEYSELGIVNFEAENGNTLTIDCKYVNGKPMMTLEDTEKLARWAIANGNEKGHELIEQVIKARMKYNIKKN